MHAGVSGAGTARWLTIRLTGAARMALVDRWAAATSESRTELANCKALRTERGTTDAGWAAAITHGYADCWAMAMGTRRCITAG